MLVNVERLQARMDEEGLDGIVATTLPNVHYFAGFWSLALSGFPYTAQCYAAVTRDEPSKPYIVTSTAYLDQVQDGFPNQDVVRFGSFYREGPFQDIDLTSDEMWLKEKSMDSEQTDGPLEALIITLNRMGLKGKKVGIDELGFKRRFFKTISEELPKTEFVKASQILRWVRKVKTPEEVNRLREVAGITERAMIAATGIAREGVTEYELAREFERSIVSQGARPQFTLIRIGRNAVAGQRDQSRKSLQKGDIIWFDTGATYQGYWSDIARCFSFGEPSVRAQKIYNAMLDGEKVGIAKTNPGMTGGELFDIVIEATRRAGVSHYRRHHVGHGIGSEVYEPPLLAPNNEDIIETGCVINIETPYYEFGLGALHVEDPYVVRKDGEHELLTTLGREMHVLPV